MTAEIFTWYDADGTPFILNNGTTYDVRWGVEGRLWPEYEFITDEQYLKAGDRVNFIKVKPRTITLPLTVYGTSPSDKLTNLRALEYAFDPMRGPGRLQVTTCDSLVKNLDCYCSVWNAAESMDTSGGTFFIFVATLHAPYPYWYSGTLSTQTWTAGTGWGPTNVTNAGNADAYPTWVITPNATITTITLTNNTTGKIIALTGMPASTAHITITTKPGSESVIKTTGINYAGYVSNTSDMWSLKPGVNNITVAASSAPTSIVATYYPQYLGV
jgi:hypothetical protein